MATTTNNGWTTPDDSSLVKDGAAAIRTLGNAIDTTLGVYQAPGLVLIKTQTVGTAVSSVAVTSAFNSTYDNYKIIYTNGVGSASFSELSLELTGITSNYYSILRYVAWSGASVSGVSSGSSTKWSWAGASTTNAVLLDVDVTSPNLARYKTIIGNYNEAATGRNAGTMNGFLASTSTATGFTITPVSGTLTGGTIRVYGYKNS